MSPQEFRDEVGSVKGFVDITGDNALPIYSYGHWRFALSVRGGVWCDFECDGFKVSEYGDSFAKVYPRVWLKLEDNEMAFEKARSELSRTMGWDCIGAWS